MIIKKHFVLMLCLFICSPLMAASITEFDEKNITTLNNELRVLKIDEQIKKAGELDILSNKVVNVATPTATTDGTNKSYVDDQDAAMGQAAGGDLTGTYPNPTVNSGKITPTKLKTSSGSVTHSTATYTYKIITGGTYCFLPQVKSSSATVTGSCIDSSSHPSGIANVAMPTSDTTQFGMYSPSSHTLTATTRYITASGQDYWIFVLYNKITKEIESVSAAPDHVSYGNGGDSRKVPHPFPNYDTLTQEVVLLDKETVDMLLEGKVKSEASSEITALIHENYKVNIAKEEVYKPLHSGKFLDKKPVLIDKIPNYIKVRSLKKLTLQDKEERVLRKQEASAKRFQKEQEKQDKIKVLQQKLKLTDEEFQLLRGQK